MAPIRSIRRPSRREFRFHHGLTLAVAGLTVLTLLPGCRCGDKPAEPPAVEASPAVDEGPSVQDSVDALKTAAGTDTPGDELISLGRDAAELAIANKDPAAVADAAAVLVGRGESDYARAMLQRSVGLMPPGAENGKAHLLALAALKTQSPPLEQASMWERVVKVQPTVAAEWRSLSLAYLLADKLGPARAAVTRGQKLHADDPLLGCLATALAVEAPVRDAVVTACPAP